MIYLTGSSRAGLPDNYGYLSSPRNRGRVMLEEGKPWAGDCGAYTGVFNEDEYLTWLEEMRPYLGTCLFVVVPDIVFQAAETLTQYRQYAERIRALGYPVALVAQNGLEPFDDGVYCGHGPGDITDWLGENSEDIDPEDDAAYFVACQTWRQTHIEWDDFDALFIGGTTEWKMSEEAHKLISAAKSSNKLVHVGRVNSQLRIRHFLIAGVDTVDGNALKWFDHNFPVINQALVQPPLPIHLT